MRTRTRALVPPKVVALLESRAREMRFNPSASEQRLWACLSGGRLGTRFVRQAPIAGSRFIADFLAPRERVIVEVDGGWHVRRRAADARRDVKLRRLGYRVLRLEAELVMRELPVALERIREVLEEAR